MKNLSYFKHLAERCSIEREEDETKIRTNVETAQLS